ncbi:MAG: outer membrane beta-barrel protein [Thiothrix sp.]
MKTTMTCAAASLAALVLLSRMTHAGGMEGYGVPSNVSAYGGASVGTAIHEGACTMAGAVGTACENSDGGHKFFAGIRATPTSQGFVTTPVGIVPSTFLPTLGVEAGYMDLGESTAKGKAGRANIYDTNLSSALTANYVAAVGYLPVTPQVELIGKAGAAFWEQKGKRDVPQDPDLTVQTTNTGTGMLLGAGAQYRVTGNISVRGEYERLLGTAKDTPAKSDADLLSIGAVLSTL